MVHKLTVQNKGENNMKTYFKLDGSRISKDNLVFVIGPENFMAVMNNLKRDIVKNTERFRGCTGVLTDIYSHTTINNKHVSVRAKMIGDKELEMMMANA